MRPLFALVLLCSCVLVSACAHPPKKTVSDKKLELQVIQHGAMRPKTYLYREVDQ